MVMISNQEKLNLLSNLGVMLTAGIPILEAIESLSRESKGNSRKILLSLKSDLDEGRTMADALSKFPDSFDSVIVSSITAAEEAGTLETTLNDISESLKKDIEFNDKIKSALTYPGLLLLVFVGVMILILTFVIPRIASVFGRLRVDLPLPTKVLIYLSDLLINSTPIVVGIVVLLLALVVYMLKYKKKVLISFLFSLPILSKLALEIDLTRFSHTMFLLLGSGVPITKSLELAGDIMVKKETTLMVKNAYSIVSSGKTLSEGLSSIKKHAPETMFIMIESGEKSGTLEESMHNLSDYFENRVAQNLKAATTLIEPIMLVIVGVLIGGMMLAIIAPIYGLIGQISAR